MKNEELYRADQRDLIGCSNTELPRFWSLDDSLWDYYYQHYGHHTGYVAHYAGDIIDSKASNIYELADFFGVSIDIDESMEHEYERILESENLPSDLPDAVMYTGYEGEIEVYIFNISLLSIVDSEEI